MEGSQKIQKGVKIIRGTHSKLHHTDIPLPSLSPIFTTTTSILNNQ